MSLDPESAKQQMAVFAKSFEIYDNRSEARGELWAGFTASDMVYNAQSKLARARGALVIMERDDSPAAYAEALDSLLDAINFCAFAVRHIMGAKPEVEAPVMYDPPAL